MAKYRLYQIVNSFDEQDGIKNHTDFTWLGDYINTNSVYVKIDESIKDVEDKEYNYMVMEEDQNEEDKKQFIVNSFYIDKLNFSDKFISVNELRCLCVVRYNPKNLDYIYSATINYYVFKIEE